MWPAVLDCDERIKTSCGSSYDNNVLFCHTAILNSLNIFVPSFTATARMARAFPRIPSAISKCFDLIIVLAGFVLDCFGGILVGRGCFTRREHRRGSNRQVPR